ncbi:MAG: gephyrin-like molybdotransferase Glp [Planctomycetota bacterium]|jgi:molybdopterin molybdotransferase
MIPPTTLFAARERVLAAARPLVTTETVDLAAAHGRHLAVPVHAAGAWPATDRSAMDGFALRAADAAVAGDTLPVVGESLAGKPFVGALSPGQAIRIMTGAVVPPGADCVVPVEFTSGFAGAVVTVQKPVAAHANVRVRASELAAGALVLPAGRLLRAAEIGVLAVLGHATVPVVRRPRVAILATGDEVVPVNASPLPHQVRESNSWALAAQVVECGGEALRLGIAPDEPGPLRAALQRGLAEADVLLTIGGISKGTHDLVHGTLAELGVQPEFHGIDLKPGKPTFFGVHGGDARRYVFGLPGNPASTFTVFDLLVRPLLQVLLGDAAGAWSAAAPAGETAWQRNGRLQALPARLEAAADGRLTAALVPPSPSGDPFGLAGGDVYVLVPGNLPYARDTAVQLVGRSGGVRLP